MAWSIGLNLVNSLHIVARLQPHKFKKGSVKMPTRNSPLSQSNTSQLDQVSHAWSNNNGLLIRVPGLIITLHLFHHKLGVTQESVFSEAVKVQPSRRNGRLRQRAVGQKSQHETENNEVGHSCHLTSILFSRSSYVASWFFCRNSTTILLI